MYFLSKNAAGGPRGRSQTPDFVPNSKKKKKKINKTVKTFVTAELLTDLSQQGAQRSCSRSPWSLWGWGDRARGPSAPHHRPDFRPPVSLRLGGSLISSAGRIRP